MALFFTADLHLGHVNVIKWRPFGSLDEMHEVITERWNATVEPSDIVVIVGDVVMGHRADTLPLLKALNGWKVLLPGNHDHVHPMHPPKVVARWTEPYSEHLSILKQTHTIWWLGQWVTVCHFPRAGDHTDEVRYPEWRLEDDGTWLIHGHLHSPAPTSPDRPRHIDVGMDAWDFTPVPAGRLAAMITV